MISFNETIVRKRLKAEGHLPEFIEMEVTAISNLHESLQESLSAWVSGIESDYEYAGISLSQLKDIENCDHLNAMFTMSAFIKDPTLIDVFRSVGPEMFRRRCGGHRVGGA